MSDEIKTSTAIDAHDEPKPLPKVRHEMEFGKELKAEALNVTNHVFVDGVVDEAEQDKIDALLDGLHGKLASVLKLTDAEAALLGIEPPSSRKSRKDARIKPNNGNGKEKKTVKVSKP